MSDRGPRVRGTNAAVRPRRTPLQWLLMGMLLVGVGLAGACGGGGEDSGASTSGGDAPATAGGPVKAQKLTWAIGNGIPSLDSVKNFQPGNWTHTVNTYEAPMRIDDDGKIQPALAASWDQPDPRTIVLKMREGVKFQDGSPMTVDDVVFSLARNIDPDQATGAGGQYYGSVRSIRKTGADEVTVKLKSPDPLMPYVLASPAAQVTSQAYFEKAGKKFGTPEFPGMGTGPYGFVKFNPATGYTLKANPYYWDTKPTVQDFEMKFIEDPQARLLAFQSGELDGTNDIPAENVDAYRQAGETQFLGGYFWYGWSFETTASPWNDVNVRKAVAHATDAQGLMKAATGDQGEVAQSLVTSQTWSNLGDDGAVEGLRNRLPKYEFDIEKARAALKQSSHPNGFKATTTVPSTFPELRDLALNTAQNLKEIGIDLQVKEVPEEKIFPLWLNLPPYDKGGAGLVARLFTAGLPDPSDTLGVGLRSDQIIPGGQNSARFDDERVDQLFADQQSTTDQAKRFEALGEIAEIAQQELPYHGAFFGGNTEAVRKGLRYGNLNPYTFLKAWIPTFVET